MRWKESCAARQRKTASRDARLYLFISLRSGLEPNCEHGHGPRHYPTDAARPTDSGTLSRRTRASALIRPPQWSMLTLCTVDPPRPDLRPPTRITLLLRSNAVYMRCLQLQLPQTPELNGSAFCGSAERSKTE